MSHIPMSPGRGRAEFSALHRLREAETEQPEENYHEQNYQTAGRESALGYDQRLLQTRYTGVDALYDGSQYEEPTHLDEAGVRSTERGVFKSQVYSSAVPLDAAPGQPKQQTYGLSGWPPSDPVSPPPQQPRPNYKPSALRWPFLVVLLLAILSFIGLLVYAMHMLPHANDPGLVRRAEAHIARGLPAGVPTVHVLTPTSGDGIIHARSTSEVTPAPIPAPISTVTAPVIASTRPQEDYGDVSGTEPTPTPGNPPPEDYGDVSGDEPNPTETRPQEDYGHVSGAEPNPTETRPSEDYGDVSGVEPPPAETGSPDDFGDVSHMDPMSTPAAGDFGDVGPATTVITVQPTGQEDSELVQTVLITPTTTVETNPEGVPTATVAVFPSVTGAIRTSQTTVLTDSSGRPTSTAVTEVLATQSITVEADSNGVPTATRTGYNVVPTELPEKVAAGWSISYGMYFVGRFLPTVLAMLISIPIRILDLNARTFQPWHELTRPGGISGRRSLCLETGGFQGIANAVRWVFGGHVLILITTTLVLASSLLVPLSAEAIALDLQNNCVKGSGKASTCIYVVSVFKTAAGVTLALLALMALLVMVLIVVLARWQSGVGTNPWSICGIACLSLNEDVRRLFNGLPSGAGLGKSPEDVLTSTLKERSFALGYFYNAKGGIEYGVTLYGGNGMEDLLNKQEAVAGSPSPLDANPWYNHQAEDDAQQGREGKRKQPFFMLGYFGRILLLLVLCGMLTLILYYNNTGGETAFEHFMMSESFGVRFLFTGAGFIITLCWSSFLNSKSMVSP